MDTFVADPSRLPGELRVLAVRLEALGMNARPLWDAAKLAAAHAKDEAEGETAVSPMSPLPDAGLSAERGTEIRELERWCVAGQAIRTAPRWLRKWPSGVLTGRILTDLLAALDAERERCRVMEQRGDNLKVEAGTWRDFAHFHKERADRAEQQAACDCVRFAFSSAACRKCGQKAVSSQDDFLAIVAQAQQADTLAEALAWYGDRNNWAPGPRLRAVDLDEGGIARIALAGYRAGAGSWSTR